MSLQFKLRRGLTIPLAGEPEQVIEAAARAKFVALVGLDFLGLRPAVEVEAGDRVELGQTLFTDKRHPEVRFVAPGAGEVCQVNRGHRRVLQSVVIRLDDPAVTRTAYEPVPVERVAGLGRAPVAQRLQKAGLWPAFRTRPFSRIPAPDAEPAAIFVTAMDTNPLAADPAVVVAEQPEAFAAGLAVLRELTPGQVYVCQAPGAVLPVPQAERLARAEFAGPHPAGLAGTHVHFLAPVDLDRAVWTVGYQDVIAIGRLFVRGELWMERVVALGGPMVRRPRLLRTRLGAGVAELIDGELPELECRVISGSPLSGRRAAGWGAYLGRYHTQIAVLREGRERELFGWLRPGGQKFSATNVFTSSLFGRGRPLPLTTSLHGSARAMVPIGVYEQVMPQDLLPTQLLRALLVQDTEMARKLGCLELDEEDLALCSFVCPGKYDYGPALRANLELIEKEG